MEVGGQLHAVPFYPQGRPSTHCTGEWLALGSVWTSAENLALTWIRSPDRPARNELQYRLSYPGPRSITAKKLKLHVITEDQSAITNSKKIFLSTDYVRPNKAGLKSFWTHRETEFRGSTYV